METSVTIGRRWLGAGLASIFRADTEHLHHRLVARGMSHRRAVLVLYSVCLAFGVIAYVAVLLRDQGRLHAVIVGAVAAAMFVGVRLLYRRPFDSRGRGPRL
jgi:UDP-GlcNAc:undecaprenyl-phosphate GlcNAc-1-phosphate transferase